ncbi:MAG: hypothetical protein K9L32_12455 [Chromatiaceae bacterium]|nr:hypothetical protein [Chromatiaceae bacterium]MCF8004985.1 hypothetical protein [Chromatiaceae bacterium]
MEPYLGRDDDSLRQPRLFRSPLSFAPSIAEATLQGLHCFCLTVDRHASGYLNRVFGPGRYAVLRQPEGLPVLLVDVLRQLLRG